MHVAIGVPLRDKIACLKTFVQILCEVEGIGAEKKKEMTTALLRRERQGTTGVGIAIPHTKCDIDCIYCVIGVLAQQIEFNAIDDRPVYLVAMLIAPLGVGADILKLLAYLSRLLRDESKCCALKNAASLQEVSVILDSSCKSSAVVREEVFLETDWEALVSSWTPDKRRKTLPQSSPGGRGNRAKARG